MPAPVISFVVPAHDEAQLLRRTLQALRSAADSVGVAYDITVVDDASTDATADIAREEGARVVPVQHRQIARARNAGARATTGALIVFVDADTIVPTAVLRGAVAAWKDGAVGGGAPFQFDGELAPFARAMRALAHWTMRNFRMAAGCFVFCSRADFEAVGGFDERLFALEEIALSRALRVRGRFVVLPLAVETSGRKLRTQSGRKLLGLLWSFARRGPAMFRDRDSLGLWYGPRRPD